MAKHGSRSTRPGPRTHRSEWIALALILVLGAGLRAAYLLEIVDEPDFSAPGRDALYHDYWARALATGDWTPPGHKDDPEIRTTPYMRPPGYPFFLAAVYRASDGSYLAARVVQMLLGLANAVLAFFLGRAIFDSRVGLVFAAFMATYWVFIYYEGELHASVLAVTATLALLWVLRSWTERPSTARIAAGGALIGLFALLRPNALLLAPAALGWLLWLLGRRGELRRGVAAAAVLTASVVVPVAPVTVRNLVAADDFVLLTTNAGINLYLSYNEHAEVGSLMIPELAELSGLSGWTCFEYPALVRGVERSLGKPPGTLRHSEASSYFARRAWEYVRQHPGEALRTVLERALLFWGPQEISSDEVVHYDRRHSAVLSRIPGGFSLVLALALAGAAVRFAGRRREGALFETSVLLAVFAVAYFASVLPLIVGSRYRVPILPCLLLFGSYGVVTWARWWRQGRARRTVAAAVAFVAVFALVRRPWVEYVPDEAAWHFNRAASYETLGELSDAAREYRRALGIEPGDPDAHTNLGSVLARLGETESAIEHFRAALASSPGHAATHNNLAVLLRSLGRREEAIGHFRRAVEIRPDYVGARRGLGRLLADQGRLDEAVEHLSRAAELEPSGDAKSHHEMGMLLARTGNLEGAVDEFSKALELDPDAAPLEINLGNVLAMLGRMDEAVSHFRRATELDPAQPGAYRNLAMAYATLERYREAANAARAGAEAARRAGAGEQARELERLHHAFAARASR